MEGLIVSTKGGIAALGLWNVGKSIYHYFFPPPPPRVIIVQLGAHYHTALAQIQNNAGDKRFIIEN
jgi:hypothetical protein